MRIISYITNAVRKNQDKPKEIGESHQLPKEERGVGQETNKINKSYNKSFNPISLEVAKQRVLKYLGEDYTILRYKYASTGAYVRCKCGHEYDTGISETTYKLCPKCNVNKYKIQLLEVKDEDMVKKLDKGIYTLKGISNQNGSRFKNRLEVKHNYCLKEGTIAYYKIRDGVWC